MARKSTIQKLSDQSQSIVLTVHYFVKVIHELLFTNNKSIVFISEVMDSRILLTDVFHVHAKISKLKKMLKENLLFTSATYLIMKGNNVERKKKRQYFVIKFIFRIL